jgi:hypothetical protein
MSNEQHYTKQDLQDDLALMVTKGLLDISMREDGEWVYSLSDKAAAMTEEEREVAIIEMNKTRLTEVLSHFDDND